MAKHYIIADVQRDSRGIYTAFPLRAPGFAHFCVASGYTHEEALNGLKAQYEARYRKHTFHVEPDRLPEGRAQ